MVFDFINQSTNQMFINYIMYSMITDQNYDTYSESEFKWLIIMAEMIAVSDGWTLTDVCMSLITFEATEGWTKKDAAQIEAAAISILFSCTLRKYFL